jgi:hypothetical protein
MERHLLTLYDNMVHYNPDTLELAQTLPPVCPRCGSHRTEIVGTSDDGRTMTVRCHACGERSRVETAAAESDEDATRIREDGSDELEVMRLVGRALAQLPDVDARLRVLRWAADRFEPARPTRDADAPATRRAPYAGDQALSIEGVETLFVDPGETPDASPVRRSPRPARPERLESLVDGFVSDFQRVAVAWQSV